MSEEPQDRPVRRVKHWIGLAVVLILVALLVVPPLISINRYKSRVTQLVSRSLGRPVRLSGVELRMLPRPGFLLSDLTVEEEPAFGAEPILHATTVMASIRFSSLWRGHLEISRISVDDASLNLVYTPQGHWNLDSLFRTAAVQPGANAARRTPLPYMEATNARINIKNGAEKLPFSLLSADASLSQESDGVWTVRRLLERMTLGGRFKPVVGSPEQVADEMVRQIEEADLDGFNLIRTVSPGSMVDFIDLVIPVLQERGRYKRDYAQGTLREKLFGRARLAGNHAGAAFRVPAASKSQTGSKDLP